MNDTTGIGRPVLDPGSLTLLSDELPVRSVTVRAEGTYTLKGSLIVFTPLPGFVGPATPVRYRVADVSGSTVSSTYSPTVMAGVVDVRTDTIGTGPAGSSITLDPAASLPGLLRASVRLLSPDGDPVRTLEVPGRGTWTVDPVSGTVTFTPSVGFTGDPSPVTFTGSLADGTRVTGGLTARHVTPVPATPAAPAASGITVDRTDPTTASRSSGRLAATGGGHRWPSWAWGLLLTAMGSAALRTGRGSR